MTCSPVRATRGLSFRVDEPSPKPDQVELRKSALRGSSDSHAATNFFGERPRARSAADTHCSHASTQADAAVRGEVRENLGVQAFVPKPSVEALDEGIPQPPSPLVPSAARRRRSVLPSNAPSSSRSPLPEEDRAPAFSSTRFWISFSGRRQKPALLSVCNPSLCHVRELARWPVANAALLG